MADKEIIFDIFLRKIINLSLFNKFVNVLINLSKEKPEEATAGGGSKGKAKKRMMALIAWGGDEQGDDDAQTEKERVFDIFLRNLINLLNF